jgi:HEPN domain-containing protein
MKATTRDWLKAASDDLLVIDYIIDNNLLTNVVAFHAQQVIEKSFKAVVEEFNITFKKTHNLQSLFLLIENVIPFEVNEMLLAELDRLYIDARYPGDFGLLPDGKPTVGEGVAYKEEAFSIHSQIERFLSDTIS